MQGYHGAVSTVVGERALGGGQRLVTVICLCLALAAFVGLGVALLGPLVFLACAIALAVALALLSSSIYPLWCMLAVIILLPFATLPVDLGVVPTFLEVALVATLVVGALSRLRAGRYLLEVSPVGWFLLALMGLMLGSFVLGMGYARPTVTSLRRFADMLLSLFSFYIVLNLLSEPGDLQRTVRFILCCAGAAAFLGVALYFMPQSLSERLLASLGRLGYPTSGILRYIEDDPNQPLRAIGTSVDPNVFGGMLAFMGGIAVPQLFLPGSPRRRLLVLAVLAVVALALLLTFSRSSMVGLAVALLILGLVRYRKLLWLLLAGALLIVILPPTQAYVLHFIEGVQGQDLATQMRFGEYKDALTLISRYPWFGVGFTGAPDVDIYIGVSSLYLLITEEMGLVGLALFLVTAASFFIYTWPRARLARRMTPELEAVILGCETAVMAGLVAGVLDHYLFNLAFPHASALLWVTIAIGVAAARAAERGPALQASPHAGTGSHFDAQGLGT